jgi:hypothetical protein
MRKYLAGLFVAILATLVFAAPSQAISLSWCRDTLAGNVGSSQPNYVRDNDIGYIRKQIETAYGVDIVDWYVSRQALEWGGYGDANGAIRNTVTYKRANGTGYTAEFWCEKDTSAHVYTDWPVGSYKYGVFNP